MGCKVDQRSKQIAGRKSNYLLSSNVSWNDSKFEMERGKMDKDCQMQSSRNGLTSSKSHQRLDKSPVFNENKT